MAFEISFSVVLLVNLLVFYALIGLGVLLVIIGKYYTYKQRISPTWILMSAGIIITSFRNFVESGILGGFKSLIGFVEVGSFLFGFMGSFLIILGAIFLIVEKTLELSSLRRREEEVRLIVKNLRNKYLKGQIEEEDLKKLVAELEKELAEIEVKLKSREL